MSNEKHNAKLEEKREEKKQQAASDSPNEKRELVMHGATLKCQYAQGPGKLVVTSNELKLQDQLLATEGDGNNMVNVQFQGTCGHPKWPQRKMPPPPCMSVIKLSPWQNLGTNIVQDQTVLVKESYIDCDPEFNAAAPKAIPKVESIKSEAINTPIILDAYFVKWTSEKAGTVEQEQEVYDKKTKKKVKVKKKVDTSKVSFAKIKERGLSYQVALVIETEGLSGKKLKVSIKSGKTKVLTDVDTEVPLMNLKDIEAVTNPEAYKDVKPKAAFDIEVDNLANDSTISNAKDFKNKAVVKLMLNNRADDLAFDWAELIMADAGKAAYLYVEVTCNEPNVVYNGKEGSSKLKNTFLNGEGEYFMIKYLEQPWLVTARNEMKLSVNEEGNCKKIIDEYHQVNRQHQPKGCATITNAWCASFVGWCLKQNGFSAQLDPGAYTYGHINTRYRAGFKKHKDDKKALEVEEFSDPIWGQETDGNKIALGAICVVNGKKHVTFAVAQSPDKSHFYGLGGNQGDAVNVGSYKVRDSSTYPIEYKILNEDYELPIYYRSNKAGSVS